MRRLQPRDEPYVAALLLVILFAALFVSHAYPRDIDGRYAQSPLKPWFDSLKSGRGSCCSDADGTALSDVDWDSHNGHYRVRIENQWVDVPDDAVIKEPNRSGVTMVWPVFYRSLGAVARIEIRCFIVGAQG